VVERLVALLVPLGVEERLEELLVEGEGASRRDIAAGLAPLGGGDWRGSVVVGSSVYLDQRASTSGRVSCGRFSRLAARVSKQ